MIRCITYRPINCDQIWVYFYLPNSKTLNWKNVCTVGYSPRLEVKIDHQNSWHNELAPNKAGLEARSIRKAAGKEGRKLKREKRSGLFCEIADTPFPKSPRTAGQRRR